jgi:hypothetical protein
MHGRLNYAGTWASGDASRDRAGRGVSYLVLTNDGKAHGRNSLSGTSLDAVSHMPTRVSPMQMHGFDEELGLTLIGKAKALSSPTNLLANWLKDQHGWRQVTIEMPSRCGARQFASARPVHRRHQNRAE